jgi:hypothetical protein
MGPLSVCLSFEFEASTFNLAYSDELRAQVRYPSRDLSSIVNFLNFKLGSDSELGLPGL